MSLEHDIERGRLADSVLNNRVYAESHALLEKEIYRQWHASRDKAEREELHQLLRMLEKAKQVLESTMRSGKVAADKIAKKQSLMRRAGRVLAGD